MDSAGHARLSDIGFARLMPAGELNFDWAQVGAAGCRWAAPEIFQKGEFTTQSDVFSYGFVAAEVRPSNCYLMVTRNRSIQILTGNFLWEDIDSTNVRSRILRGDRPHVPEYEKNGTLIMGLWGVFAGCWGKDPASRILASEALNVLQYLWVLTSHLHRCLLLICCMTQVHDNALARTIQRRSLLRGKSSPVRKILKNWTRSPALLTPHHPG